LVVADVALTSH